MLHVSHSSGFFSALVINIMNLIAKQQQQKKMGAHAYFFLFYLTFLQKSYGKSIEFYVSVFFAYYAHIVRMVRLHECLLVILNTRVLKMTNTCNFNWQVYAIPMILLNFIEISSIFSSLIS